MRKYSFPLMSHDIEPNSGVILCIAMASRYDESSSRPSDASTFESVLRALISAERICGNHFF